MTTDNPHYRYCYADPPYLTMCDRYDHHHPDGRCWDDIETHMALIDRLGEFDGWALSLAAKNLRDILPICPADVRVAAWIKPFASFKPGVNPGYCWEPVIFHGGRRRTDKSELTVRDYLAEPMAMHKGFIGAKPAIFCRWVANLLGVREQDEFVDLFPGSGIMGRTLAQGTLI